MLLYNALVNLSETAESLEPFYTRWEFIPTVPTDDFSNWEDWREFNELETLEENEND